MPKRTNSFVITGSQSELVKLLAGLKQFGETKIEEGETSFRIHPQGKGWASLISTSGTLRVIPVTT